MAVLDYIAIILACMYACLCGTGIFLLYLALKTRNRKLNLRNSIVTILTVSSFLRCLFFMKVTIPTSWDYGICMALFIIPLWMQCLATSLLICFYATTYYINSNHATDMPIILCSAGNLIALILDVAIASSFASDTNGSREDVLRLLYCITCSAEDLVLAGLLVYFGALFHSIAEEGNGSGNVLAMWSKKSISQFEMLNRVLTAAMLFRASLSITFLLEPSLDGIVSFNGEHPGTSPIAMLFFIGAELLPTLCIFYMISKLNVSQGGKHNRNYRRFRVLVDGSGVEAEGSLDERLLSVEDSSIRIFVEREDTHATDVENLNRHKSILQCEERQGKGQLQRHVGGGSPPPQSAIPGPEQATAESFTVDSRSVFHEQFSPDESSLVEDLLSQNGASEGRDSCGSSFPQGRSSIHSYLRRTPSPANLNLQHGGGMKVNRQHSPSIYSSSESPSMLTDTFAQISEEMAGNEDKGGAEKYSEFVSPRDILLSYKKRNN